MRVNSKLTKIDPPVKPRKVRVEVNPHVGWKKCRWCGAEKDGPCMGDDDKPATEVCEGRAFKLPSDKPESGRVRRRGERTLVKCSFCDEMIEAGGWGGRHKECRFPICKSTACYTARNRAYRAEARERERQQKAVTHGG